MYRCLGPRAAPHSPSCVHHNHHHPTASQQHEQQQHEQQQEEQPSFLCGWLKLLPLPASRNDNNNNNEEEEEEERALLSSTSGASSSSSSYSASDSGGRGDVVRASICRRDRMNDMDRRLMYTTPCNQPSPPKKTYKQRVLWAEMDGRQLLCYARPNNTYRHTTTTTHASSGPQGGGLRLALPVLRLPLKVRFNLIWLYRIDEPLRPQHNSHATSLLTSPALP